MEKFQKDKVEQEEGDKEEEHIGQITKQTFASLGVCPELVEACSKLDYKFATKVQAETLPYALKRRDVIALAETGSGKTLAFALPIIQDLLENPRPFFGLIISPTRELCLQISDYLRSLGAAISLKTCVLIGGLDQMTQAIALAQKPHIIVASHGRLLYHLKNTRGFNLQRVRYFVLDEADKLLNMDFEKDINQILTCLPKKRTTFLYSATMTNKVSKLQRVSLVDPVKCKVNAKYKTVGTLKQYYVFVPQKYKDCNLVYLLNEFTGQKTMIFCNTCMNSMK